MFFLFLSCYRKNAPDDQGLHRFCAAEEEHQVGDPDYSAMNARKALEHIARALYEMKHIPVSDRTSLFELVGYIHDTVVA